MDARFALQWSLLLSLLFSLIGQSALATTYSNAESGDDGWTVFDNRPAGATIRVVNDAARNSRVISFTGDGRSNSYLLGGINASSGWNNRREFIFEWKLATTEPTVVQVYVDTTSGVRRMVYTKSNSDSLKNPSNNTISFGLGSSIVDGVWRTNQRDLANDVAVGEPGNRLLGVNGIVVLGTARIDDVVLITGGGEPSEPPSSSFSSSATSGTAPLRVTFNGSGSTAEPPATVTDYAWNFANGITDNGVSATTTFSEPGSYRVRLTVTDSNSLTDTSSRTITVTDGGSSSGGSSSGSSSSGSSGSGSSSGGNIDPESADAARLLSQAAFGASTRDIAAVRRLGVAGWIEDQFSRRGSSHLEYARNHPGSGSLTGPRQHKWLINAIDGNDQLRQRVAFALSQILVVSDVTQVLDREQYAIANYYDMLSEHAFGNYRELLEDMTLSPIMGLYLSMLQNARSDPDENTRADENFAREIMQLFTIGLHELNNNGSQRLDSNSRPIPAYTQRDVEEYARVFTGWNYSDANRWDRAPADGFTNKFLPMRPFPGYHDTGRKVLLGGVVARAGLSPEADLDVALDSLFNHRNVGPFIGKQLIQRLVTSNPGIGYVGRVARAFNNNGAGVRGDLRAVIRAILLDPEARTGHTRLANYGKLREPLLRWTHLWRAFNVQRGARSTFDKYNHGSPYIYAGRDFLGQSVLSANSVFGFFRPEYAPLGAVREAGIVAPEAQIYTDAFILTTTARLTSFTQTFYQGANQNSLNSSHIDITQETALAARPQQLLDRLNLLLLSGQMSSGLRTILLNHMATLDGDEAGRSQRVRDCITLIMASPEYLVQK